MWYSLFWLFTPLISFYMSVSVIILSFIIWTLRKHDHNIHNVKIFTSAILKKQTVNQGKIKDRLLTLLMTMQLNWIFKLHHWEWITVMDLKTPAMTYFFLCHITVGYFYFSVSFSSRHSCKMQIVKNSDSNYGSWVIYPYPFGIGNSSAFSSYFGGHCVGFVLFPQTSTPTAEERAFLNPEWVLPWCGIFSAKSGLVLEKPGQLVTLTLLLCRLRFSAWNLDVIHLSGPPSLMRPFCDCWFNLF